MDNQALIKKADMALSDLASGGVLTNEQANTFVRKLIATPTIIRSARNVLMSRPKLEINKIGFGSRILRPAVESTALSAGDRSKPTFGQVLLDTKEVIAEINIPYAAIEDNIEGGNVNFGGAGTMDAPSNGGMIDTMLALIAERTAYDLEELALLGDTGSGDAYLALLNGFLKQATSHVVAHGAKINRQMFKNGLIAMPDQYLRDKNALRHFVSVDNELEYADTLAGRETALGDAKHQQAAPNYGAGVLVTPVSQLTNALGFTTHPLNMIFGIHRQISFEVDKDIRARKFIVVVTARVDFKFEEEDAVVKYTTITSP